MLYNQYFATKPFAPLKFTQMAWARSSRIGCGVAAGDPAIFVVCRYSAKGNVIGQNVYRTGTPCSACDTACSANGVLCLP
ncbi:hypothetical protein OESDEN_16873 [Oesophagostomum dentatum]|uniref:SCP domain-containing protein n=1 Tax=Oesophagostomum dentatum TaxID=61180 RepID=A0A0B1SJM0_OESDE|nr:hypothetical protein OESDEN_16873 [Oesophagostomum dentatum]